MNKYGIIDGEDLVVIEYTLNKEKYDDLCNEMATFEKVEGAYHNTQDPNKVVDYLVNYCNVITVDSIKMRSKKGDAGFYDLEYHQLPGAFYTIKEIIENPFSLDSLEEVFKVLDSKDRLDREEVYNEYVNVFNKFFQCFEKKEISRKKVEEFRQTFNDYIYVYDLSISDYDIAKFNVMIEKYIKDAKLRTKYIEIVNNGFPDIINIGYIVKERKLGK